METTSLKYEDITHGHPCSSCHKPCNSGFVTFYDVKTGSVKRVICHSCDTEERYADYCKTNHITTYLWTDALLSFLNAREFGLNGIKRPTRERWRNVCEIHDAMVRVNYVTKLFEKNVWFASCAWSGSLQSVAVHSQTKGMSSQKKFKTPFGEAKFLLYTMCGRAMITLETDDASVTLITDETSSESCMGVRGICATGEQACGIITAAIEAWRDSEIVMEEDRKVGMGF